MLSLSLLAWANDKQIAPDLRFEASWGSSVATEATTSAF
jgi:hypothetical protein